LGLGLLVVPRTLPVTGGLDGILLRSLSQSVYAVGGRGGAKAKLRFRL
jgi:hypothetical protein